MEAETAWCQELAKDREEIIKHVQKLEGFEDFLHHKRIAALRQAAVSGPVIILLASGSSCSALIVKCSEDVQHIELPALNIQTVKHYADLPRALSDRNFNVINFLKALRHGEHSTDQSDLEARLYGATESHAGLSPNDIFCKLLADVWQTIVKPVFNVLKVKVCCRLFF
jgi:hypothetical protein